MFFKHIVLVISSCSLLVSSLTMAAVAAEDTPEKSRLCAGCHGTTGISIKPEIPNLAGQKKDYMVTEIHDFREGKRKDPMMSNVARILSDEDIEELATFFSHQDTKQDLD